MQSPATMHDSKSHRCPEEECLRAALCQNAAPSVLCTSSDEPLYIHAQIGQDALPLPATRHLLAATDTALAALSGRCHQPIPAANRKYCAALLRTLERCRRRFGRFTLRCNKKAATACSTRLAQIQRGRCGARRPHALELCSRSSKRLKGCKNRTCCTRQSRHAGQPHLCHAEILITHRTQSARLEAYRAYPVVCCSPKGGRRDRG